MTKYLNLTKTQAFKKKVVEFFTKEKHYGYHLLHVLNILGLFTVVLLHALAIMYSIALWVEQGQWYLCAILFVYAVLGISFIKWYQHKKWLSNFNQ